MTGPLVVVVAGPAGSGKSTFGRELARAMGAAIFDQDVLTNPLMAQIAVLAGIGDDLDHPALGGDIREARYACVLDSAADNVSLGRSVVLVAPFTAEIADLRRWKVLTDVFSPVKVALVWVTVDPEIAWARRQARGLPRDRAGARNKKSAGLIEPAVGHIKADGASDPALQADRIIGLLPR